MSYVARVDGNQRDIVSALRKIGAAVWLLFKEGKGCPDLLVGYRGRNYLIECKNGGKLNPEQEKWHREWLGQVAVANSPEAAVELINRLARLAQ